MMKIFWNQIEVIIIQLDEYPRTTNLYILEGES